MMCECGKTITGRGVTNRCRSCSQKGRLNHKWKGGIKHHKKGYIYTKNGNIKYQKMVGKNGYVLEHRIKMAQKLGRNLTKKEVVHHKNSIRNDNRIHNLQLMTENQHNQKKWRN